MVDLQKKVQGGNRPRTNHESGKSQSNRKHSEAIFVIALVLIIVAAFAGFRIWQMAQPGCFVVIHDGDGGVIKSSLQDEGRYEIETSFGKNVVVIGGGRVYVSDADCPHQDCVRQGAIDEVGEQIICLPHRMIVEIVSSGETATGEIDRILDAAAEETDQAQSEAVDAGVLSGKSQTDVDAVSR